MTIKVITNNVPRPVIDAWELNATERAEFDYIDWDAVEQGQASASFFRYKGELHDLGEFMTTSELHQTPELRVWAGYQSDSFFSGLVVRWVQDWNREDFGYVVVGRYLS